MSQQQPKCFYFPALSFPIQKKHPCFSTSCISFEAPQCAALWVRKQSGAWSCWCCTGGMSALYLLTSATGMVSGSVSKQNQQGFPCVKENQIRKVNPVGQQAVVFPAGFPRGLWKAKYHLLCFAQLRSIPSFFLGGWFFWHRFNPRANAIDPNHQTQRGAKEKCRD